MGSLRVSLSAASDRIERPERLVVIASEQMDLEVAEAVVRQLLHLQNATRRTGYPVEELTELQASQLGSSYSAESDELSSVPTIARPAKAIELSYDSDNLF